MNNELAIVNSQVAVRDTSIDLVELRMNADKFPRIHQFAPDQATYGMAKIVTQAFLLKGIQADPDNIQFIASELTSELLADNERIGTRVLTFPEISRAIRKAILTTDMYGISVATLYKVLTDYVKGEGHRASKEAEQRREKATREAFEKSPINTMLQAYAGAMRNNINK